MWPYFDNEMMVITQQSSGETISQHAEQFFFDTVHDV